jgi:nicotinate-nucleotide pyrophosphorylase (carboxylating)
VAGVAPPTARFVEAIAGTRARIIDTRKTTPGLRLLEKYAVLVAGASNHRFGLDDGILVKDNHVLAAGGVAEATRRALEGAPHGLLVEVEVRDLGEFEEAIIAGAHVVLLDNMSPEQVAQAVDRAAGRVILEASGGIELGNVRAYAEAGVDLISVGALTHSAPALDISLEVEV